MTQITDRAFLIFALGISLALPVSCLQAVDAAQNERKEVMAKIAALEADHNFQWGEHLDAAMSEKGFTLHYVEGDTKEFPSEEIRKDGVAVWRVYTRTFTDKPKIEYLGPPESRYQATKEFVSALTTASMKMAPDL